MNAMRRHPGCLDWPTSMPELLAAEQFAIWSLRAQLRAELTGESSGSERLQQAFESAFGDARMRSAAMVFVEFYGCLRASAQRSLYFHQPHCPALAADEVCLLTILTACQHGDETLASALAELIVHPDHLDRFLRSASAFAATLEAAELHLPMRDAGSKRPSRAPFLAANATRH